MPAPDAGGPDAGPPEAQPAPSPPAGAAESLLGEGRRRYEAGDLADSEPLARRALELRPPGGPAEPRAEALQLVAEIAYSQGRYPEAGSLAEAARDLRAGGSPADVAETDNLLGIVALARGDVATGTPLIEGALAMRTAALGPDASDTIESLNNLAAARARAGRIEEGIGLSREALARSERAFGEPHRQLAVALNGLAVKLDRSDETRAEAGELYARAVAAAEAALGPEHPIVATFLANVATQRLNAGDPEAARPFVARSIDLHERRHGQDHPNTASALMNAVELARLDGDLVSARALAERALSIRLATFGPTDIRTRTVIARLLTILGGIKEFDPAVVGDGILILEVHRAVTPPAGGEPAAPDPALVERLRAYLVRRLAAARDPLDAAMRQAIDRAGLATVAADRAFMAGDHDAARVALDDAIRLTAGARGSDDLGLVELLHRRASVARADERGDEALGDDERALAILAATYGGRHPFVLRARAGLARDLSREYGPAAARPVFLELRALLDGADAAGVGQHLREVLDQSLARIPEDAVPDPVGRSARRRRAIAASDALARDILGDLDRVAWSGIGHARGPATDVPANLRLLAAEDPLVVADAAERLVDALLHRGSLFPATPAVLGPLEALAADPRVPQRAAAIELLAAIVARSVLSAAATGVPDADENIVRSIRSHIPAVQALLGRLTGDPDPTVAKAAVDGRDLMVRAGAIAPPERLN